MKRIAIWTLLSWLTAATVVCAGLPSLINPGFEEISATGQLSGWTVLHGLDEHGYGEPDFAKRFDAVRPTRGIGGYHSEYCLAFPADGTWFCPIFMHGNGDNQSIDGRKLGKAAVFQAVELEQGTYCFRAHLRTADGAFYSAAFSLGLNIGKPARYANDASTGIRWTGHRLAMRHSELRGVRERGEWARWETDPFTLNETGPVTVWIRFNYANDNQFETRWQADNAEIIRIETDETSFTRTPHTPCAPPPAPMRHREFCGDLERFLTDAGDSTIVDSPERQLFRHAREPKQGRPLKYTFPVRDTKDPLTLLVAASGQVSMQIGGSAFEGGSTHQERIVTREYRLPPALTTNPELSCTISATGSMPARIYEIELGSTSRTEIRLSYVEADVVRVPWIIGVWDATSNEFDGQEITTGAPADLRTAPLTPAGRWHFRFTHLPEPGHRYWLIHGLLRGTCRIDIGDDGIIDWIARQDGEEIVDLDVTDLLADGENVVTIDTTGQHDFAALVETCPDSTDLAKCRLAFEGDELADLLTRVADNTWFWLAELHYEPTGFVDASIPLGHWQQQLWPVDIAFAFREWLYWGRQEESLRIARFMARYGWHGHPSNRSGGIDNTAGNILVRSLCETIRRSDGDRQVISELWPAVRAFTNEVIEKAEESPFGLIRGTNWENSGNHEHGPAYALSTTLGAAAALRKAALTAEHIGAGEPVEQWRQTAERLRSAVLERLVLSEDHRGPSGFIFPKGTWAYGLRTDGTIEDEPLAGYFWAGGAPLEVEGFDRSSDGELLDVYDRTLTAALPLIEREERGVVSRYATSYDGPGDLLASAILADRINALAPLVKELAADTDSVEDIGARYGELSRWASGGPDFEDTNLVCAAGFVRPLRLLAGIDDLLTASPQLSLYPRLPWPWKKLHVNDWPIRYRTADGKEAWTALSYRLERTDTHAQIRIRTKNTIKGMTVRLGPFRQGYAQYAAHINGTPTPSETIQSGDATWVRLQCNAGATETIITAKRR